MLLICEAIEVDKLEYGYQILIPINIIYLNESI